MDEPTFFQFCVWYDILYYMKHDYLCEHFCLSLSEKSVKDIKYMFTQRHIVGKLSYFVLNDPKIIINITYYNRSIKQYISSLRYFQFPTFADCLIKQSNAILVLWILNALKIKIMMFSKYRNKSFISYYRYVNKTKNDKITVFRPQCKYLLWVVWKKR